VAVFSFSITITGKAFEHRASEVSYIVQQMNSSAPRSRVPKAIWQAARSSALTR
jgi:hypothetical protein